MKLTRREAIDKSIKLWEWLTETGQGKHDYPAWEGWPRHGCYLCEFAQSTSMTHCDRCPYYRHFQVACDRKDSAYRHWYFAQTWQQSSNTRKKYAVLFLEQLRQLK